MNERKKINLLPIEIKNKYISKYMVYLSSFAAGVFVFILILQYTHLAILNFQINHIQKENDKYTAEKETITSLQKSIEGNKRFIESYNKKYFPMAEFMYDIELNRPESVYIISADTPDRLINEGKTEEEEKNQKPENKKTEDKDSTEDSEGTPEEEETAKIEYVKDISEQEIIIRGYGENQDDISKFIYNLTNLPYISYAKITAIEEHKIENGLYNIFEVTLQGGIKNEAYFEG